MIAILHNIRSLHNVGSIFRTADAVGVEKIYLCGITPGPVDRFGKVRPQIAKVSLGAERTVPYEKVSSVVDMIKRLKKEKYKILALEQSPRAISYQKFKTQKGKRYALIVGNEVKGLPKIILKKADTVLKIQMFGKKESLNVAVAFGIAAFRLRLP